MHYVSTRLVKIGTVVHEAAAIKKVASRLTKEENELIRDPAQNAVVYLRGADHLEFV